MFLRKEKVMQGKGYGSGKGASLAGDFVEKLRSGEICEATRPNSGKDYTGSYEQIDLMEYKEFIESYTYRDLFGNPEVDYGKY